MSDAELQCDVCASKNLIRCECLDYLDPYPGDSVGDFDWCTGPKGSPHGAEAFYFQEKWQKLEGFDDTSHHRKSSKCTVCNRSFWVCRVCNNLPGKNGKVHVDSGRAIKIHQDSEQHKFFALAERILEGDPTQALAWKEEFDKLTIFSCPLTNKLVRDKLRQAEAEKQALNSHVMATGDDRRVTVEEKIKRLEAEVRFVAGVAG